MKAQNNLEGRVLECEARNDVLSTVPGAKEKTCIDCGALFWSHPKGVVTRCCQCRENHRLERLRIWNGAQQGKRVGFPRTDKFQSMEEVDAYLAHERLTCLICGGEYRGLHKHLERTHEFPVADYRQIYGIPCGRGLVGTETSDLISENSSEAARRKGDAWPLLGHKPPRTNGDAAREMVPAMAKRRRAMALIASEAARGSPNSLHRIVDRNNIVTVVCSSCGAITKTSEIAAITSGCRLLCDECKTKRQRARTALYNASGRKRKYTSEEAKIRRQEYAARVAKPSQCGCCGVTFIPSHGQIYAIRKGHSVYCSKLCGGIKASQVRWAKKRLERYVDQFEELEESSK